MPSERFRQVEPPSPDRRDLIEEVEREFWTHVVHELKTPLAMLHGYASTLLERDLPEDQRRWFLQVIADQSLRMSEGIDRLRELRRLERAKEAVSDAAAALQEAVRRVAASAPDVRVAVSGDGRPIAVRGSASWLARAFEEVLWAFAAADPAGGVTVRLRRGTTVSVTVSGDRSVRLSGLGLYLARRVVERFGGAMVARQGKIALRLLPG